MRNLPSVVFAAVHSRYCDSNAPHQGIIWEEFFSEQSNSTPRKIAPNLFIYLFINLSIYFFLFLHLLNIRVWNSFTNYYVPIIKKYSVKLMGLVNKQTDKLGLGSSRLDMKWPRQVWKTTVNWGMLLEKQNKNQVLLFSLSKSKFTFTQ